MVAKCRTVSFGLGRETQKRGERRREEERRERRGERKEDRGERREERREERGKERGEKREERREKRGQERKEDDPGPKYPNWFRAWGVIILAVHVSVSAFGFVDPIRFEIQAA